MQCQVRWNLILMASQHKGAHADSCKNEASEPRGEAQRALQHRVGLLLFLFSKQLVFHLGHGIDRCWILRVSQHFRRARPRVSPRGALLCSYRVPRIHTIFAGQITDATDAKQANNEVYDGQYSRKASHIYIGRTQVPTEYACRREDTVMTLGS